MLSEARLKQALIEHFDAELQRDVDWIRRTVAEDVEYHVIGPHYPDDPQTKAETASGRDAVGQLWENYYRKFSEYKIECTEDDMLAFPERNLVFAHVRITATPAEDFEGFPAGKPFSYQTGALCEFDDSGEMVKETVFGSLGQVLMDLRRMREFLAETGQQPR